MKYAIVQKAPSAWECLVRFSDSAERAEQAIRFEYEYPEGTFVPVREREARRAGFESCVFFADPVTCLPVEMCGGLVTDGILRRRGYRGLRAERLARAWAERLEGPGGEE